MLEEYDYKVFGIKLTSINICISVVFHMTCAGYKVNGIKTSTTAQNINVQVMYID